ncbi:MAG: transketolase C-terminal domain-containing protein [bacterium]
MITVNPTNARIWSKLGSRGSFGTTLAELGAQNANILAVSADLCNTSGLDRFRAAFPDRFFNVGIAEQNMIGVSAGLSSEGYVVFGSSFSNFIALRSCEQVRHYLGYMQSNVKLVGLAAGFPLGMFGNTHYGLEDISMMRVIPNITVLSPADGTETVKATIAAAEVSGPVYLRLTGGMNNPIVYKEDYKFEVGRAITLKEGGDVAIIATGSMVHYSLEASKLLEKEGLSVAVIDMHTIKPLDGGIIDKMSKNTKIVVTVEEHRITGGLGSAVAEYRAGRANTSPQVMIGVPDEFSRAGDYRFMLDKYGLTAPKIAGTILERYASL